MIDEGRNTSRVLVVLMAGLIGLWYFQLTLWHTDLWGHLTYGRVMVEQSGIPAVEPFIPSASDTPLFATAWLSQVVGYHVHNQFGAIGLKVSFAIIIAFSWLWLALSCRHRSGSVTWAMICSGLFLGIAYQQLRIIRPQLVGVTLFCFVLFEISRERISMRTLACVSIAFCLWANSHPSFPVGLGLLVVILFDRITHSTVTLKLAAAICGTAVIATCLNPYGVWIYRVVLGFAASPNLQSIVEWQPLTLTSVQGKWVVGSMLLLLLLLPLSKRKPSLGISLLLVCLTVLLFRHSRFVIWWAVVTAYVISTSDTILPKLKPFDESFARLRIGRNALIAAVVGSGVAWMSYDGNEKAKQPNSHRQLLSSATPFEATNALLKADLPNGSRIFSTYEFSDYLLWNTWPRYRVVLTSHVHLLPPEDWQHYLSIIRLNADWHQHFNEFKADVVVADLKRHAELANGLQSTGQWTLLHIDDIAIVLVKKTVTGRVLPATAPETKERT